MVTSDQVMCICRKCGGNMHLGKALEQTWVGTSEWPGELHGTTMSPGGSGMLIDCMKCEKCGWSCTLWEPEGE